MKKVGKIMLLVSGICLLAVSIWSLVVAVLGLVAAIGGGATAAASSEDGGLIAGIGVLAVGIILFVVGVVTFLFYLFAGIRGIKTFTKGDDKNITKAFVWAIIILALNVVSLVTGGFSAAVTVGLVVDVVYIVGAFFVKLAK